MEMNENEWTVSNHIGSGINGMKLNHFMTILLLNPYFKIKCWIYRGILEFLVKISLNLILFPHTPAPPTFLPISRGMKIWDFKGIEKNEYSFLPIPFSPT